MYETHRQMLNISLYVSRVEYSMLLMSDVIIVVHLLFILSNIKLKHEALL